MHTRKNGWFWIAMTGAAIYGAGCMIIMAWEFIYAYRCLVQDQCAARLVQESEYGSIVSFACFFGLSVFVIATCIAIADSEE